MRISGFLLAGALAAMTGTANADALSTPAMGGSIANNSSPMSFDSGFGDIYVSGAVTGTGVVPGGAASVAAGSSAASPALTGLTTLLTGTNTLRVWADGPNRSRVAVISQGGESDIVRNGTDLWLWQSAGKQAQGVDAVFERGIEDAVAGRIRSVGDHRQTAADHRSRN